MIREYPDGAAFLEENGALLDTQPYLTAFFRLDAPLLHTPGRADYALRAEVNGEVLLALKVEPFALQLFGSTGPIAETAAHLTSGGYMLQALLGDETLCGAFADHLHKKYGMTFTEALAMDFMLADEKTAPSCPTVEVPTAADTDELVDCLEHFVIDCGLQDKVDREEVAAQTDRFRILRADGRIVSMASISRDTDRSRRITDVYTRPDCRGKGYARLVVNTAKNEILDAGYAAVLNVDKKNPISNALYRSLGFVRLFSQGEFRRV